MVLENSLRIRDCRQSAWLSYVGICHAQRFPLQWEGFDIPLMLRHPSFFFVLKCVCLIATFEQNPQPFFPTFTGALPVSECLSRGVPETTLYSYYQPYNCEDTGFRKYTVFRSDDYKNGWIYYL